MEGNRAGMIHRQDRRCVTVPETRTMAPRRGVPSGAVGDAPLERAQTTQCKRRRCCVLDDDVPSLLAKADDVHARLV